MNTKPFLLFLVVVLVLGGTLGGAFVGGVAVGKSQGEDEEATPIGRSALSPSTSGQGFNGEITPDQLSQLRQQLGRDGGGFRIGGFGGGGRPGGRSGLTGPIESIEGNTVTIDTPQGSLQATIGADTTIQIFAQGTLEDLQAGLRVTVVGAPGEDGTVQASSILITPEGNDGSFGGGLISGDRFQRDQQLP